MSQREKLNDRKLEQLEARLRGAAVPLPEGERDRLLFACGVETGKAAARHTTLRWLAGAAVLMVVIAGANYGSVALRFLRPTVVQRRSGLRLPVAAPKPRVEKQETLVTVPPARDPAPKANHKEPASREESRQLSVSTRAEGALALLDARPRPPERDVAEGVKPEPTLRPRSNFVE